MESEEYLHLNTEVDTQRKIQKRLYEVIEEFNRQTPEQIVERIRENGENIAFANDQTEELQLLAVQSNPKAIEWIRKPTQNVLMMAKLLS